MLILILSASVIAGFACAYGLMIALGESYERRAIQGEELYKLQQEQLKRCQGERNGSKPQKTEKQSISIHRKMSLNVPVRKPEPKETS